MNTNQTQITNCNRVHKRFISIDFARGLAIFLMLIVHTIMTVLNIGELLDNVNTIPMINLVALIVLPYIGALAGFFLLVSATGNMVSTYRDLEKGKSIKSIVFKQIFGGILLLAFGMLSEGLLGYMGVVGDFFMKLNDPSTTNLQIALYRWNHFETIHTIAWCIIINGIVQGFLSINNNWKNRKRMIISYVILIVLVLALTQPIWDLIAYIVPHYPSLGTFPYGEFPSGHTLYLPWIGTESFGEIFRTIFLNPLAAPEEPIFPYLAVSFIGSIIGIVLTKPKEEVSKKFPRRMFLIGLVMFLAGTIGIIILIIQIASASYGTIDGFDAAIEFYRQIPFHRHWSPDKAGLIITDEVLPIPKYAFLTQFLSVNGFSLMLFMFLFRMSEFRGTSKRFAKNTRIIRRFGIVAFSNYNIQWIYRLMFFFTSLMIFQSAYQQLYWGGTFLTILLTLLIFSLLLYGWEKIHYIGSFEWFMRTVSNNIVPARRDRFDSSLKWWNRGRIDVQNTFYNPEWIEFVTSEKEIELKDKENNESKQESLEESKLSLRLAIIGLCSIIFVIASIIALFVSLRARKLEGKNKQNTAALIISITTIILLVAFIIVTSILPISLLGLF